MKILFTFFTVILSSIAFSSYATGLPNSNYEKSIINDPQFSYFPGIIIIENKKNYDITLQGYNFPFAECFIPVDFNSKNILIDNESGKITLLKNSFEGFKINESVNCFSEKFPERLFAISSKNRKSSFLGYNYNYSDKIKISYKLVDIYTYINTSISNETSPFKLIISENLK